MGSNGSGNGKAAAERKTRNIKRLAKIVFDGQIEDGNGKMVRELYEDEANWELAAQLMHVEVPPMQQPQRGPALVGGSGPQPETIPVPVAGYEVRQPTGPDAFVYWFVPISRVRCIRIPHDIVEVRDARGDVAERVAMRCSVADAYRAEQAKKAELVKGDATEH